MTPADNALFAAAFSYYHYITFLGFSALPFLSDTVVRARRVQRSGALKPSTSAPALRPCR